MIFSTYDQTKSSSGFRSGEEGGLMELISSLSSQSRSSLSGACRIHTSSPPSYMHSQLCVRRLNLWQSAE